MSELCIAGAHRCLAALGIWFLEVALRARVALDPHPIPQTSLAVVFTYAVSLYLQLPLQEFLLVKEGDFLHWGAKVLHRWVMLEDSVVITIRWASAE